MPKLKEKEKKKYSGKGGPKRRGYLNKIARNGKPDAGAGYLKYGDINPRDVHEGVVTYRGTDYYPATSNITVYGTSVFRAEGKEYFMYPGTAGGDEVLWHAQSGINAQKVQK